MGITAAEVKTHNSRSSCWIVIHGNVYDVTDFLDHHPGGPSSILRFAGQDATEEYEPLHPAGTIERNLRRDRQLGPVEDSSGQSTRVPDIQELPAPTSEHRLAPLSTLQNLGDFEKNARKVLSKRAWIYYSSASDSFSSYVRNHTDWTRIHFRPRILRNVAAISTRARVMGHDSALPIFIAPAALAKLGHEDGELCLGRGAQIWDIPYCCSTYSSVAHADIAACMRTDKSSQGAMLFQLYVPINKPDARELIHTAKKLKCKALVVTVDSAVIGKREEDDRYKAQLDIDAGVSIPRTSTPSTDKLAPVLRGAHTSTLDWEDLNWIREEWSQSGDFVLKGIQSAEDAALAARAGVDGIYLSNHGGRQLDHAPSSISTLLEIRKFYPDVLRKVNVYVDGGVTRGSDVVKALCLGAKAVGLGRPFMYALSGYGTEGVCRAIEILNDEIQTTMRLNGVTTIEQLNSFYVNASDLERDLPQQIDTEENRSWSKL